MPLTLKDVQCFLLKKPCLQLYQTIPGWVAILCRVDCSLQLNFWGKFQLETMALFKNGGKGKNKGFVLILKFCL